MKSNVNLLPVEFRRRSLMSVRIRQWSVTFSICFFVVMSAIAIQWHRLNSQKQTLTSRRVLAEPYKTMEQDLARMQEELSQLHANRSLLAEAHRSTHTVKLLGLASRSANENLQIKTLEFKSTLENTATEENSEPKSMIRTELILDGIARDNLAISQMQAGLKSGQVFDSVEVLKISETKSEENDLVRSYSITCRIDEVTR